MPALTALYREQGFLNPTSYIQSGNVVFDTRKRFSTSRLALRLEKSLLDTFGFTVGVIVITLDEMKKTVAANPFLKLKGVHPEKLYVTFLAEDPPETRLENIVSEGTSQDLFAIMGRNIYLYVPGGYGKTKLSNHFFETKLQVAATTRNWRTVNMLMEMAASR